MNYTEVVPSLAYVAPPITVVQTASKVLVPARTFGTILTIMTLPGSTGTVWLNMTGGAAVVGQGIAVLPGGLAGGGQVVIGRYPIPLPTADITAITDSASPQTVCIFGG